MLLREVRRAIQRLELRGRSVLVAASGGVDSSALLHALALLARSEALSLSVGHVNHGLRGAESEADEAFVRGLAADLGLPVAVRRIAPGELRRAGPSRARPTLQEAARTLRYAALRECAPAGAVIATAHHADDQAETVLLRLLRGTGPDGLRGIPERSRDGGVVRPLLRLARADVLAFARERGLGWREDSSNASGAYARNRLRRDWLPGLAREFNPRLLRAIAGLAEAQARDSEWIEGLVEREAEARFVREGCWLRIDARGFAELPPALAQRLAREALLRCRAGRDLSRVHLDRIVRFLGRGRPGTRIELPGQLRLCCESAGFSLGPLSRAVNTAAGAFPPGDPPFAC